MGSKSPSVSVVQPPPPTVTQLPQPSVAETSSQLAQSQLQYNPQLAAQQVALQRQYAPQLAQSEFDIQQQYGPLYRSLYEQMFPSQTQGLETLAQQSLQRLQSPTSLTPQQQSAQDMIRNREQERFQRGIRSQANLGGTLYSGATQRLEREGLAELGNQYALQDIQLQQQQRQQTLQELIASGQVIFPQVQQPNAPAFGQSVTPSPDALLQAMQNSIFVQPAAIGFGPSARTQNWNAVSGVLGGIGSIVPG